MRATLTVALLGLAWPAFAQDGADLAPQIRARHDVVLRWAPRYRLDVTTDPLGLEQRLWRRVDSLPLYHRANVDATGLRQGLVDLHFAGWGTIDLLASEEGGVAAGDVAIGFVELRLEPLRLWAGRRFMVFGPPGGLHVDGGGVSLRSAQGVTAEVFVGRPVTYARASLLGPEPDFHDATVAYGARIGYADSGSVAISAGYAELWSRGLVGSRTVDLAGYGYVGRLRVEAGSKIDVRAPGVAQARIGVAMSVLPALVIDTAYLHLEPARWIPTWSILSVFEASTFDELGAGATWRPLRALALRVELAGRAYQHTESVQDDPRLGYRAEVTARVTPIVDAPTALRVLVSRRGDGVLGYTLVTAGVSFDPRPAWLLAFDGAFAIDDAGRRDSLIGSATVEATPHAAWKVGTTVSLARTPIVEAELRAMLRATWTPEPPR